MALPIGTPAPAFTLFTKNESGLQPVSLSDYAGSKVVILFFPAAFTGVCTEEFCSMSGGLDAYANMDATVFGISCDTPFAQEAWAKQNNITVTLLGDYAHTVTEAFDVVFPNLAGLGPSSARAAFVIDRDGVIQYSEQTATPKDLPDFDAIQACVAGLA